MEVPSSSYRGVPNPLHTLNTAFNTITASTPYLFGQIYHFDVLKGEPHKGCHNY